MKDFVIQIGLSTKQNLNSRGSTHQILWLAIKLLGSPVIIMDLKNLTDLSFSARPFAVLQGFKGCW